MRTEWAPVAGEPLAARAIASRPSLKADQREMVRRLLVSPERVAVVIGEAGTGKSFAVLAAAEGWAQAGIPLRVAAPTWRAAGVLRADGLPAVSVATLLSELDRWKRQGGREALAHGSALVIDEAAMVDSASLARLVAHAERAQAKLVLIGDPEQLGEIEAGGLFRALAERTDPIRLEEVIRHEHRVDREAAKLIGAEEVEVGEAGFAAGDRVLTRVNDRAADLYNRERWQVAEVDAEQRRVVLDGIDRARCVEVNADYLARTNPHSGAPALQHAYAVTTYSAQGTTADRAFVMVDPSMDKQELYVAASRSRGETRIYATPEIQGQREEIAPAPDRSADVLPHIAQAAVRDRAQLAAHDAALRSRFSGLPTEQLVARSDELLAVVRREANAERELRDLRERVETAERRVEGFDGKRERAQELKRRVRKGELARIDRDEADALKRLDDLEAQVRAFPAPSGSARREFAVADRVLAERRELAIAAAHISPPPYIKTELGERPRDPSKREAWNRGVEEIETYRQRHGVNDPNRALGRERDREKARETLRRVQEAQRALGLGSHASRERDLGRSLGIGR